MSVTSNSSAAQLVHSYPNTLEMYPEVVKALKARFERDDLLKKFYIRELLKLILHNTKCSLPIESLYDVLQCHLRNLEVLNVSAEDGASERNCMSQIGLSNPEASSKDFLQFNGVSQSGSGFFAETGASKGWLWPMPYYQP